VSWSHGCGIAVDGSAYCWGDNEFGQLGDGTLDNSAVPVMVVDGKMNRQRPS